MSEISVHDACNPDLARLPTDFVTGLQVWADGGIRLAQFLFRRGLHFDTVRACPKRWRGRMRECYANAGRIAMRRKDLTYCEGFAMRSDMTIPVPHGWLLDAAGHVIDPTWQQDGLTTYFGIAFCTRFMVSCVGSQGTWCVWKQWFDLSGNDACDGLPGMLEPRWHLQRE